jgi:hypothetical protein
VQVKVIILQEDGSVKVDSKATITTEWDKETDVKIVTNDSLLVIELRANQ